MYFRKKRKVGDILGIAAAAMLLVGCGGRGVEDQARMEGVDTASQSHQNEAEAAIEGEISQDRTEETSQGGQQEQQERPEETLQDGQEGQPGALSGTPGVYPQDRLDAGRFIEEQSFPVILNDWGEVQFVSYEPDPAESTRLPDVTFYLLKGEEILYQFPYIGADDTSGYGLFYDVKFVMFTDTNTDGKDDVVIGAQYMSGAGPQGAIPHVMVRIYEDCGDYFTYNEEFSDTINGYLPWESNVLAKDVKRLIQLTGGSDPLTDYESYSGKWRVSTGYIEAYEDPAPVSRNELTCSIINGNEFTGSLFTEQGMTERIASVDDIVGTIQNGELYYGFTDDGWGGTGTLHIMFLPNQINVEVLDYEMAEENASGYGISGDYEMTVRE